MLDKLEQVEQRFLSIQDQISQPDIVSDMEKYTALMKELKQITPVVEKFREYKKAEQTFSEAKELIDEGGLDPELAELAQEDYKTGKEDMERLTEELKVLLLPRDPNDDKNVIIEIRAGTGGEEAALFAGELYRMYTMYAEAHGFKTEIMSENSTELGGYKEVSFEVKGDGAYSRYKFESGTHRVQRVPETESQGRIQTSAATVAVLPEAEAVDFELDMADVKIDVFRSSGAGGQKVNKTSSAIRATYLPTGLVVECQDERSQFQNKDKALTILRTRLYEEQLQKAAAERADARKSMVGSGDRSERIRTYNFPQGRVTDHRINLTLYKIEQIMNGDLDELIDALITADTAEKLKAE
ncbi:MAG: peptide chain release factor 1 [Clostridia bacterium]|nr:peptide chain release factor 1 [Clostridia bacterium]MBQ1895640.1 peptide chain release factor 1 [Clostridia bacterium]MBQ2092534.1 peptide chain release factor 1 [Clostridia bacterium]MBQ2500433.1 peptide chain release factor 1 [Clostridia bacterium]MBQ3897734.1 peptide chain release factor 1 [Clostridia bacterium]